MGRNRLQMQKKPVARSDHEFALLTELANAKLVIRDQRSEIRQKDDEIYKQQEALRDKSDTIAFLENIIRGAQDSGELVLRMSKEVKGSELVMPVSRARQEIARARAEGEVDVLLMKAIMELRAVIDHVDSMATYCANVVLPDAVKGYDELLMAKFTGVIGAAKQADLLDHLHIDMMKDHVIQRVEAIQAIPREGVEGLKIVVLNMSFAFKQAMKQMIDRARQGRVTYSETERIANLAYQIKYVEGHKWGEVPGVLLHRLDLTDEIDLAIRQTVEAASDPEQYIKNLYHGFLRSKANKGRSVEEIFSQRLPAESVL